MVHNVEFSCSHISFVWLHGLNSLQWWLLTCPDLTNVVWFKNNIDRHEYPKQLQAHPAKKSEIPDTRNTRWFWKKIGYGLGIAKNYRVGSGIGYPSVTDPNRGFRPKKKKSKILSFSSSDKDRPRLNCKLHPRLKLTRIVAPHMETLAWAKRIHNKSWKMAELKSRA